MDKGNLETFYTSKPEGKFIALFSDGSGGSLFWRLDDDENGNMVYCDHEGDLIPDPETYFIDAGYNNWIPLPDNFEFWFEGRP